MSSANPTITRHLRIHGLVQGVWYRRSTCIEAERLGVCGWVRNRADGSVEAIAQGSPETVAALIAWAHRGPPKARVERVEDTEPPEDEQGPFTGFVERPSC